MCPACMTAAAVMAFKAASAAGLAAFGAHKLRSKLKANASAPTPTNGDCP